MRTPRSALTVVVVAVVVVTRGCGLVGELERYSRKDLGRQSSWVTHVDDPVASEDSVLLVEASPLVLARM